MLRSPEALADFLIDAWDEPGLAAIEPEPMLVSIASRGGLAARYLEDALDGILATHWDSDPWRHRASRGWRRFFRIIAASPTMSTVGPKVVERFTLAQSRLQPLAAGPAADPWLEFLVACANHQIDRSLVAGWLTLCDLPSGAAMRHGAAAVLGVAAMRDPIMTNAGDIDEAEDEAEALVRFATALGRRVEGTELRQIVAVEHFHTAAEVVLRRAAPHLVAEKFYNRAGEVPAFVRKWFLSVGVPIAPSGVSGTKRPDFAAEANDLLGSADRPGAAAFDSAIDHLLNRERAYAERSGDVNPVVLSLTRFARHYERSNSVRAVALAEEAVRWQPFDRYARIALIRAHRVADDHPSALDAAYLAVRRFPGMPVVWTELGVTLRGAGQFTRAEQVMRVAVQRFPKEERLVDLFAHTLRLQRRLPEAETMYRRALELSDDLNQHSWDGLVVVLALQSRIPEARVAAHTAADLFPDNRRFPIRLDQLAAGGIDEPSGQQGPDAGPRSTEAKLHALWLVRHAALLSKREEDSRDSTRLLAEVDDASARDQPRLRLEQALDELSKRQYPNAAATLRSALNTFPDEVALLHAQALCRRAEVAESGAPFSKPQYSWLTEPADRFESSNPGLGPLAEWSRVLALSVSSNGDEWQAKRESLLERFPRRLLAASVTPAVADHDFVRLWAARVQSAGGAILSDTFDRGEALIAADEFAVLDEDYALLGSSV